MIPNCGKMSRIHRQYQSTLFGTDSIAYTPNDMFQGAKACPAEAARKHLHGVSNRPTHSP